MKRSVLIAEDEADILALTSHVLKKAGFKVVSAKNGQEALDLFKKSACSFDLAVIDISMPGISGTDLALSLRNSEPELCILFTSGLDIESIDQSMKESMRTDFIQKPYTMSRFMSVVSSLLDRRRTGDDVSIVDGKKEIEQSGGPKDVHDMS